MIKQDVIAFFDRCAPGWDTQAAADSTVIEKILDNAEIGPGMDVLDVACGTGVLFPYYKALGAASVTAVDISPEMAKIAACKCAGDPAFTVICADVEEAVFDRKFDRIVVYNALPHFPYPKRLIKCLTGLLKDGGRLTVAHGESRAKVDAHHHGAAAEVSEGLMPAEELKKIFDKYFDVEVMISNSRMYQVSGVKRDPLEHSHCGVTHSHGGLTHTHSHGDVEHTHAPAEGAAPMDELLALMRYLVSHNDAHAQEVADLAGELLTAGRTTAYDEIMDAVSDFDIVNAKLDSILCRLTVEEY